ncbi:MAG: hypothetical protein KF724_06775 [Phycisphaeraceae bacterium]|nr:hypothetical protein [Phycisphaeraceae bacterium]
MTHGRALLFAGLALGTMMWSAGRGAVADLAIEVHDASEVQVGTPPTPVAEPSTPGTVPTSVPATPPSTPGTAPSSAPATPTHSPTTRERGAPATRGTAAQRRDSDPGRQLGSSPSMRRVVDELSPEDLERVVAVARDISKEWGDALATRLERDPAGLRAAIAASGPRLLALASLKLTHPELYSIRVEDLRIQGDLKRLSAEYRSALARDPKRAEEIAKTLREKVERQVDLDLLASAKELQALDEQLKRLVEQLRIESQQRSQRIEEVLEEIKQGGEPRPMVRPWSSGDRTDRPAAEERTPPATAPRPASGPAERTSTPPSSPASPSSP